VAGFLGFAFFFSEIPQKFGVWFPSFFLFFFSDLSAGMLIAFFSPLGPPSNVQEVGCALFASRMEGGAGPCGLDPMFFRFVS